MSNNIKGKVVVITGASSGMGNLQQIICLALVQPLYWVQEERTE